MGGNANLLGEMDALADELRNGPHVREDDQLAFRQLQRAHMPDLTTEQFHDLFEVWRDRYRAREAAKEAKTCGRIAKLCKERDALIAKLASVPGEQRSRIDARLARIGMQICRLYLGLPLVKKQTAPAGKLGVWVSESEAHSPPER